MIKNIVERLFGSKTTTSRNKEIIEQVTRLIAEGNAREDEGRLQEASTFYRRAIEVAPTNPRGPLNLGIVLAAQGLQDAATVAFEKVLQLDPANAYGNYNFARLCYIKKDFARAEALLSEALTTKPDFLQALVLMANVLDDQERTDTAIDVLDQALQLNPVEAGIWFNHAGMCQKISRLEEAESSLNHALRIEPDNLEARRLLSRVMRDHGLASEALRTLIEQVETHRKPFLYRSEELFLMNYDEAQSASNLYQRHLEFGRDIERQHPIRFGAYLCGTQEIRRLRVGFVSSDFLGHPVSLFMMPLLERLDREKFTVLCYSSSQKKDHFTEQIQILCDQWLDAAELTDSELSEAIHADAVDILVDLGGHSSRTRMVTFAEKPAPVQATWLGYLNTTGLTRIDYRICDARTDPPETSETVHTEKLLYLPSSQWCYRPFVEIPLNEVPPFKVNGYITFGSFNSALKLTSEMLVRMAHVLKLTPDARLLFSGIESERKRQAIRECMAIHGIGNQRFEFSKRVELDSYYKLISSVDIALDCYPYGGGTTTLDCLWMGVPVVTATGDLPVSRSAASILFELGLNNWIAPTIAEYVETAVSLALDREEVANLRSGLRDKIHNSPLMDEVEYVRNMELAFKHMWSAYCNRLQ